MQVLKVDCKSPDASSQFAKSLTNTGFAVLTNHGLESSLIDETYKQWDAFFNSEDKFNYPFESSTQDGYFPMGTETAKGYSVADLKEFYHVYPQGRVPEYLQETTFLLRSKLYDMAKVLLNWLQNESSAELAATYDRPLPEMLSNDRTLFRIIYYPPIEGSEEAGAIRAAKHEDINLLTLLPAASADGLQVQDVNGNWHDVPCDPGSIAVNCGDMLDMLSKGFFPATPHRVVNPEGTLKSKARMSMPMFSHPKADVLLKPGFTAEDYLDERLKVIGIRQAEETTETV